MGRLFGTDGVRGIANTELTPSFAFKLGKAGAYVLSRDTAKPVILIGTDTRISGDMLKASLTAGVLAIGGNVIDAGIIPTPAVAYLVRYFHATAGVVISASHNPFEYNGIKFFNSEGYKLDDSIEDEIENILVRNLDLELIATGDMLGKMLTAESDGQEVYSRFLINSTDVDLKGKRIVLDCANGAAYKIAARVYSELGAKVITIGDDPNGTNINDGVGSTHPEALQRAVVENGAFIGMAFDGDADRLIAVDEKGEVIDGDRIICICAKMLKEEGELTDDKVTVTVMSNLGLHKYLDEIGCTADITGVGDRYVLERMKQTGCVLGGEQSGHIIFRSHTTTGDGILSSLQLIKAVLKSGVSPSELAASVTIYPQVLVNAKVRNDNKEAYKDDEEICRAISALEKKMDGKGRILIRPSGTEPLVRVMLEGENEDSIAIMARGLADMITRKLG
ncbi:MAG: phosphoglucosamine mutase [Eubacteriaceae bacterium]|jgi:phosphoglucosamine mutase|nr:phosphoglucosamine mutase [Eubacteriaceae bacterium]